MVLKRLFFFFDRQAILMEKRKNRWTLDHTLKMQSVYSLTHTCPLKAVFLSRMSSGVGSVPHPKNNKWSVTGPLLCLGMPWLHCGSQFFPVASHGQDGLRRKQFISWSLLKERPKQGSHQAEMKWPWKAITHIMCLPYIPWGSLNVGDIWLVFRKPQKQTLDGPTSREGATVV